MGFFIYFYIDNTGNVRIRRCQSPEDHWADSKSQLKFGPFRNNNNRSRVSRFNVEATRHLSSHNNNIFHRVGREKNLRSGLHFSEDSNRQGRNFNHNFASPLPLALTSIPGRSVSDENISDGLFLHGLLLRLNSILYFIFIYIYLKSISFSILIGLFTVTKH